MQTSFFKRLVQLAVQPMEAWTRISSDPGHPASLFLAAPAAVMAIGPVCFVIAHTALGTEQGTVPLGRSLGFALVYYAMVVLLLLGQSQLLRRVGRTLDCRVETDDSLKLVVWASIPFHICGFAFLVPAPNWDSVVIVAGLVGVAYSALWLYQGLGVVVRGDSRSRGLLALSVAGGMATAWIVGFYLLIKIVL